MRPLWLLALVLFFSPTPAPAAETPPHRTNGDLAIQARDIFRRYCAECHTGSAEPGQSKLKLLDVKQITAPGKPVPLATKDRSLILDLVKDGSMPPANRPGPTPAEIATLERWVKAGTPAYPEAFDERYPLQAVADDFDDAKQNHRYVSFAHLLRGGAPVNLADAESRLNAALTRAAGAPVALEPVDPAATVFRIDLAKLGWKTRDLFDRMEGRKPVGADTLQPFDLLLLEYPLAMSLPAGDPAAKRLEKFLDAKNQVRPVPFVRGDWLTAALASGGTLTPLGEDVRSTALLEKALASGGPQPEGPRLPRVLGTAGPFGATKPGEERSAVPPLFGWYVGDVTPSPVPFTLTAELVAGGQPVKSVKVDERFKLRVQCDRTVNLTLVMVQADGEVRIHDLGDSRLRANAPRDITTDGKDFRITGIITGGDSATEYFILFASEADLPLPLVVRSRHDDRPVWRFLPPKEWDRIDAGKVVRKVVPILITTK